MSAPEITLDQQIREVEEEIFIAAVVFERQVVSRRMTQDKANHRMACKRAILATLQGLRADQARVA